MLEADAGDFLRLARAETFAGVQAGDALQQALPAQHLVAAGDAAAKGMRDVEERGIAIG